MDGASSESSVGSTSISTSITPESSSSEDCEPAPAKKAKKAKVSPKKKMVKKATAPQKKLAKKAAKKGDRKSDKTIMELANEAMKIHSEKVGQEMEKQLSTLENLFAKWKEEDVDEGDLQRFAARILKALKTLDILCAVDTAIFKKEIGRIRLLEMEISSMDSETGLNRQELKDASTRLLSMVVDTENGRLDQTREGTAWNVEKNGE